MMPGGWGTLDETAEILTWRQLGLIHQPIGILNTQGFFTNLLDQMKHMEAEGFLKRSHLDLVVVASEPTKLLQQLIP
jgi:hypothetical protein